MSGIPLQAARLVAMCLVLCVTLTGCDGKFSVGSKRMVPMEEIEQEGSRQLDEVIGAKDGRARLRCPGKEIEAERGAIVKCTLIDTETREVYDATVELTDDNGKFDVLVADKPRATASTDDDT